MADQIVGNLHNQETIATQVGAGETPAWVVDHWQTFRDGLLSKKKRYPISLFFRRGVGSEWRSLVYSCSLTDGQRCAS